MIYFSEAALNQISIHRVGNKVQNEYLSLSESPLALNDELLSNLLMRYFLSGFEKVSEIYRMYDANNDLDLNSVFHFVSEIFDDPGSFHDNSVKLARHLYEVSDHPKIKPGEFYVALFRNVQIEGELLDAVGIFKSETKETYLKVYPEQSGFALSYEQEAINIHKLDKGCLIFNTEKSEGYKVAIIDQTNRSEAVYWKDDFIKVKVRNDNFNQTLNVMGVYKDYVTKQIDEEFEISKADKIDLLNRSVKYFKDKETFDLDEFSNEVIGNEKGIESFRNYKKNFENEYETEIAESFDISPAAVKKQSRVFKSVLKLDKNFHIYIHGNKDLIEKGFDDERGMNYYRVFFKEEV